MKRQSEIDLLRFENSCLRARIERLRLLVVQANEAIVGLINERNAERQEKGKVSKQC